ncbi:MAG: hypothetical protein JWR69_3325 [Pedosphaera sp.]|nr:hypothetical protein [Pedosphaera sp.]
MNHKLRIALLLFGLAAAASSPIFGQTFSGTNAPNQGTNFTFNIPSGATNLSLLVSNSASAYSYLLLKKGAAPTDTDFDFIARVNGQTNKINLELPEFALTNYGLRVRTPATSVTHAFNAILTTNRTDLRSAGYPVLKPLAFSTTGTLTNGGGGSWHYFQVDVPTNLPSGWRIVLSSTGTGNPDLYIRRGQLPTTGGYDKVSVNQPIDTIIFTGAEATANTYFIGVYLPGAAPGNTTYTLSTELGYLTTLTWDPGTTHQGTQVFTNTSPTGGDYYFKITTLNTAVGVWRTALNAQSGEADVYINYNTLPATNSYHTASTRVGSDGFVLSQGGQFSPAQDWYILVHATPGAQWTLVTGEGYVMQLPALAADASSGTNVTVGAEGMRFFKTSISSGTLAWRLGLNGLTNTILVKKTAAPHPHSSSYYDLQQSAQMLVVPTYLNIGDQYFIGVIGNPGLNLALDSRQQVVTPLAFNSLTNFSVAANNYGYVTFSVQVPVQQIAWQLNLTPSVGNANLAVGLSAVPNEFVNTAYSDVAGLTADSITLVPPTLTDGTFYVTVYGNAPYTCSLTNGQPIITDVHYVFNITNDAPSRVGWRFYRVVNTAEQLGTLGWDLFLQNQPPNTEIALRRNAVPSRWNYRNYPYSVFSGGTQGYVDFSGPNGFLQRPGHQADVWYIGVYQPAAALGPFVLTGQQLTGPLMAFDPGNGSTNTVVNQPAGKFQYYRIDVPTNVLGWDLRIVNVTSGDPRLVIRRDQLPDNLGTHDLNGYGWSPASSATWPSGYQIGATYDWTGYQYDPSGTNRYGHNFEAGIGNPLEPGTYYVGVINSTGPGYLNPMSYQLVSRGIGTNVAIPVVDLPWTNGVVSTNGIPAREAAYYRVQVPSNAPSWKVKLSANSGESLLAVQLGALPNVGVYSYNSAFNLYGGKKMQKAGDEIYEALPINGQTNIPAGTYYLAVVGEGNNPGPSSSVIGSGTSSYTLTTFGSIGLTNLGTLDSTGVTDIIHTNSNESGEAKPYQFTVPPGTLAMEVRLENRTGNPIMTLRNDSQIPYAYEPYGRDGGQPPFWQDANIINVANPLPGTYTLNVSAFYFNSGYSNATYRIRIHALTTTPVAFDGGSVPVVNHEYGTWRYFKLAVPANAFGWDIRITNITSGDPRMAIRREQAPDGLGTHDPNGYGWSPASSATWPTNYQIGATYDWTGDNANNGANEYGHVFEVGMGNPLEPGNYIVGVFTGGGGGALPMSYSLASRGIGTNFAIPIGSLSFSNGIVTTNGLPAREVAYYKVVVPAGMPSWKVESMPTLGEALLLLQKDVLPNVGAYYYNNPASLQGGKKLQKPGNDHYLMLPPNGQTVIPSGTYYLAVASEGQNPSYSGSIGTNAANVTLASFGTLGVTNLGNVDSSGTTDIVQSDAMEGTESRLYQFVVQPGTLSLQVQLQNRTGNPVMTLRNDNQAPYSTDGYGTDGGQPYSWQDANLINIANPATGTYTLNVHAASYVSGYSNVTYTVRIHALGTIPVTFDGGSASITNQAANVWQYFIINVPANAFGWDLRLTNITSGDPRLSIRRAALPDSLYTHDANGYGWSPASATLWPSNYQIGTTYDWTGDNGTNGANEYGHLLQVGMGNPLEPGVYYAGVFSGGSGGAIPMSYSLASRGIGTNMTITVTDLPFTNGVIANPGLPAREAAYYRVIVPTNRPSWKARLATTSGDALLLVQKDFLPNVGAYYGNNGAFVQGGKKMQKAGNEHYLELPVSGTFNTNIPAGTYYLAVASEGVNGNPSQGRIGSGSTSYSLQSQGSLALTNLGVAGGADLTRTNSLEGAEIKIYSFSIPPGTAAVEVRLDNRVGNPYMTLRGDSFPATTADAFARDGGESAIWQSANLITLPNPTATNYTLTVFAAYNGGSSTYSDAGYTVVVHTLPPPPLNFDAAFNTNGLTNVATGLLADQQKAYYKVVVPANFNGVPVIGWKLDLSQTQGTPSVRVRPNVLPDDYNYYNGTSPYATGEAVIVPTFLTPGTWYVEVKGQGTTAYTLTSSALQLQRPAWNMPMVGQSVSTPGLPPTGSLFGDTGVDTNGLPLPLDQGIDLAQGDFHYYAVIVPTNNVGLMSTRLDAISGDPNLFIRVANAPTLTHNVTGQGGGLYDRYLTGSAGSEYGNWVPLNGRFEFFLTPGTWYFAVQAAGNSNVRYRLRLSSGNIQDLPLNGGYSGQTVAGGDWRYYRVVMPTNAPTTWNVTFSQQVGAAVMYFRDTTPPGQATYPGDLRDWNNDSKNHGPYPLYSSPGTFSLPVPPVRPGATYYIGFRAVSDSTFSISSATNILTVDYTNTIAFYGGFTTNVIPPNGVLKYRIDVPADAYRWIHTATHSNSVSLYLDQGSVPTKTTSDHWYSIGQPNSSLNVYLRTPGTWPWQPNYLYFLLVTNNSSVAQPFSFTMNGRNAVTDDYDGDGLPDAWEITYFNNSYSQNGLGDPDGDGVSNLQEYLEGTDPTNPNSYRARLTIASNHGTVTVNPLQPSYVLGASVTLNEAPDPGYLFLGWTGSATGTNNPLTVTMNSHKSITAIFGIDPSLPNADYRFQNNLASSIGTPPNLQDIGVGNSFQSDLVDGFAGVVYRFPQGNGLLLSPSAGVVPTNVWSMVLLFRYDTVSGYRRIVDTKNPPGEFGLYVQSGNLYFYPSAGGSGSPMTASNYVQVVMTRDATNLVSGYLNGVKQFSFVDNANYGTISGSPAGFRFFIDNGAENSGGAVARIRLYDHVLTPEQVPLLDRLPGGVLPLQFVQPMYYSNAVLHLTANVTPGTPYQILASTNLVDWVTITNVNAAASPVMIVDPQAGNFPRRFYRGVH